jgi:hypothetical protein
MKKNILIILAALTVLGSSCSKDFLAVDEVNPNQASKVAPSLMLPAALQITANTMNYPRNFDFVYLWYGLWTISSGYSMPNDLTQYNIRNTSYEGNWTSFYLNAENYDYIANLATTDNGKNYLAIAKIMKAYIFHNLVDCYGNVPYSKAFQAGKGILNPPYDDQVAIYTDLVKQLDDAIADIKSAPSGADVPNAKQDIVYGGDMTMWVKFANTLKLRILMHTSNMASPPVGIATELALATDGFLGPGESAGTNPGYVLSDGKMNPFYQYFYKADGSTQPDAIQYYVAGKNSTDFYVNNNDQRALGFYQLSTTGKMQGNYFGATSLIAPGDLAHLGFGLLASYSMPSPLLTDVESLFLQAEAVQKGYITGNAQTLYESAITQSFSYLGIPDSAAVYLANASTKALVDVDWTTAVDKEKLIITQKWASLNGIAPVEIWTDFRRTGFPDFIHWSEDVNKINPTPPIRLYYAQRELGLNAANVAAVGTINIFTSKLFWQP